VEDSAAALAEAVERLQAIGAEGAEARAEQLLVNLGFSPELRARPMSALSGGWRVRVALACAIFARPDLLLLDEVWIDRPAIATFHA
jgi:ATP-binding cassette subfamily F protein 3